MHGAELRCGCHLEGICGGVGVLKVFYGPVVLCRVAEMFCQVELGLGTGLVGSRVACVVKKRLGWMVAVLLLRCLWCEVVLGSWGKDVRHHVVGPEARKAQNKVIIQSEHFFVQHLGFVQHKSLLPQNKMRN